MMFTNARALIAHLHAQKRGEYRSPSPSEVVSAIIQAGRDTGYPEMSQSVLVLAFMPTIHRTYREVRAWFQEISTEDIAQQTLLLFLELAASSAAGLFGGQLSFALARSLHRNALRWARKEQLMLFEEDRFREEQRNATEPSVIQERLGHASAGSLTLDVYTDSEWQENMEAAKLAGEQIEKAVNSVSLTAVNEKRLADENQQALVAA